MNEDLNDLHYWPIKDHKYSQWFQETKYNGKVLNDTERKDYIKMIDEAVSVYSEGLQFMFDELERIKDMHDDYHILDRALNSFLLFVLITMIDSMVASKYFILADKDYDRRYMRGKLQVILNEGFKRLYGFKANNHKNCEWDRFLKNMKHFPEDINLQYQNLTFYLEKYSKESSWWKDERNYETHLLAAELYKSRQSEIIESKVMMDSLKLFSTFQAVFSFLMNAHACLTNYLIHKYKQGEIKE